MENKEYEEIEEYSYKVKPIDMDNRSYSYIENYLNDKGYNVEAGLYLDVKYIMVHYKISVVMHPDEWFIVETDIDSNGIRSEDHKTYKCDQLDGVIQCLNHNT